MPLTMTKPGPVKDDAMAGFLAYGSSRVIPAFPKHVFQWTMEWALAIYSCGYSFGFGTKFPFTPNGHHLMMGVNNSGADCKQLD